MQGEWEKPVREDVGGLEKAGPAVKVRCRSWGWEGGREGRMEGGREGWREGGRS